MLRTRNRSRGGGGGGSVIIPPLPTSNLVFDWSASDVNSYAGSGQTILNLVAAPADGSAQSAYDFNLGASSTPANDDPVFTGVAGTPGAYFLWNNADFTTDIITLAGANTAFLNALHKTTGGSAFTLIIALRSVDNANRAAYWSTQTGTSGIGLTFYGESNEAICFDQRGDTTNSQTVSGAIATPGNDFLLGLSMPAGGGTGARWFNSRTSSAISRTYNATSTDASAVLRIGSYSTFSQSTGFRVYGMTAYNAQLDNTQMGEVFDTWNARTGITFA